jgi:MoxR-like ATPase
VAQVIQGGHDVAELAVIALLAQGHVLIEDVPGVGKTTLARALAKAIGAEAGRIQFTPDMLPGDVLGLTIYRAPEARFEFVPGPVFHPVVIADEINRASPKTQSALLEAMQESSVTVDGITHALPDPFVVLATQNPIEMDGTYALPEAQRDRFMVRLAMGYPDYANEVALLDAQEFTDPLDAVRAVTTLDAVRALIALARALYVAPRVKQYIVDLAVATRTHPDTVLGVSPRASLQLLRAAKAAALLAGHEFVLPDDVQRMVPHVWAHRLIRAQRASETSADERDFLIDLMRRVPVR